MSSVLLYRDPFARLQSLLNTDSNIYLMFDENGKCGYGQDYPDASHAKRDDGENRVPPHVLKKEGKIEAEDISGQ